MKILMLVLVEHGVRLIALREVGGCAPAIVTYRAAVPIALKLLPPQ